MTTTEQVLMQLTGRALFGAPTAIDPTAVDWNALCQEAAVQALTLLIWDALTDEELSAIPTATAKKWEQGAMLCMVKNEELLYEQEQIIHALDDAGIPFVIIKGSSSAAYYPKPAMRTMGDIDLLVKPEQQMDAVKVLQENGYGEILDENHHCHMTIHKDGIAVEVHKEPNGLFINTDAEIAQKLSDFFANAVDRCQIVNGLPFLLDEHQAAVLILHKLEHFLTSGLGLRQLCDWAVFLNKKSDEKLWAALQPRISDFGLWTFTEVMTGVCVDYLALPRDKVPMALQYNEKTAANVMEQILREGNFGKKVERYGERLFNDPNSSNRITSFIKILGTVCKERWPLCEKNAVLMPVAPFVVLGKYMIQRKKGKRPKLNLKQKYRQAGYDQKLYKELKPFVTE